MTMKRFATSMMFAFMLSPLIAHAADPSSSTSVKPLTSPTIATPTTITVTTDLANKDYSKFTECPKTTLCPDINGRWPAGGKAGLNGTCPNYCIVNSVIQTHQTGGVTVIDSYIPAICPKEFVKIDSFNVQKEVKFNPTPPEAPFPIPDVATYTTYTAAGYTCGVNWGEPELQITSCKVSTSLPPYEFGYAPPSPWDTPAVISANGQTGVGIFHPWPWASGCYTGSAPFCTIPLAGCDPSKYQITQNNDYYFVRNVATLAIFSSNMVQPYRLIHCTPPGGFYFTANTAPASAVCSSHQARWKLQSN